MTLSYAARRALKTAVQDPQLGRELHEAIDDAAKASETNYFTAAQVFGGSQTYAAYSGVAETGPGMFVHNTYGAEGATNEHGVIDASGFTRATKAYCSFDSQPVISGTANYDHYAGFQARGEIDIIGTLAEYYSFVSIPTIPNGNVTNVYHFTNYPSGVTPAGTVTNHYGLYVDALGYGTNRYSVYAETDKAYFGGRVGIGGEDATAALTVEDGALDSVVRVVSNSDTPHYLRAVRGSNDRTSCLFSYSGAGGGVVELHRGAGTAAFATRITADEDSYLNIDAGTKVAVGGAGTTPVGKLTVTTGEVGTPTVVLKALGSQSANLLEARPSGSSTPTFAVDITGALKPASMADAAAPNGSLYYSTTASKLVFKDSGGVVNALY